MRALRPRGGRARPPRWCPASTCVADPYEAVRRAPTSSRCSPSGTSSAGSTSTGCATRCAQPRVVDARNLLDPAAMRRRGLRLRRASGGVMPRVVVTGGAGFLGSHLCDALLARG